MAIFYNKIKEGGANRKESEATQRELSVNDSMLKVPYWKRPLDAFMIIVSIPIWLPIGLICAIWIKLVSGGSVIFRQERVGYRVRNFTLFKFRTMHENADTKVHEEHLKRLIDDSRPMTKLDRDDTRLIPGAKLIRALGLDELPQLLNVLRGDMSIVGPRPCTPQEMVKFLRPYRRRFDGLPGLTGNWQVSGKNRTTFRRMIALDITYIRRASVLLDLLIILYTPISIIAELLIAKLLVPALGKSSDVEGFRDPNISTPTKVYHSEAPPKQLAHFNLNGR